MTWRLPQAPLRGSVVRTNAAALLAVIVTAWSIQGPLQVSQWYALKAGGLFGIIALAVLASVASGHPFATFGFANQITTLRAAIVALITALVGETVAPSATIVVAAAGMLVAMLDGLDGRLARAAAMSSPFGARFDMEIDALLILALSLLAWQLEKAGAWIVISGLLRYLFVAAGWFLPWMRRPLPHSFRRRITCIVQIVGLGLVLLPAVPPAVSVWLAVALVATLTYSFLVDTVWLWRKAD